MMAVAVAPSAVATTSTGIAPWAAGAAAVMNTMPPVIQLAELIMVR